MKENRRIKFGIVYDVYHSLDCTKLSSTFEDTSLYNSRVIHKIIDQYKKKYNKPCVWYTMNERLANDESIFYKNSHYSFIPTINEEQITHKYTNTFTYLAGRLTNRPDKIKMLSRLHQENLLEHAIWSGGSYTKTKNSPELPELPHILDWDKDIKGDYNHKHGCCNIDLSFYLGSKFSLTQETEMTITSNRFTEKTLKCFMVKHPFILAGNWQTLALLRKEGFKTFHPYVDESYDDIMNRDDRIEAIIEQTKTLISMSPAQWNRFLENIRPILEHNYKHINDLKSKYVELK